MPSENPSLLCGEAQSQTNASLLAIGSLSFGEVRNELSEEQVPRSGDGVLEVYVVF